MRLKTFLNEWNLNNESSYILGADPEGKIVSYLETINGEFNISKDKYVEYVHSIFSDVYKLEKNYKIDIEEN